MKKLIKLSLFVLFLLLTAPLFAQQLNYTWGCIQGGTAYSGAGLTYIDTTTSTTTDIYIDLYDYWPGMDINPVVYDSVTVLLASDHFTIGTFYVGFDNQGIESPTTDSVNFTIKVYPGIYTAASRMFAGVDWGTAVTLETIMTINDYFSINDVYIHATKYKTYPPECIKLEIAPAGRVGSDDSTFVNWRFAYPAIYQVNKERK